MPYSGESLPGYVVRLAGCLGMWKAGLLAGMAGVQQPAFTATSFDVPAVAAAFDLSPAQVLEMAYRPMDRPGQLQFLKGTLYREFLDLSARRFCPACFREAAFHRTAWDLGLLLVCPSHGIRLAGSCPSCGRKPDWQWPRLTTCRCGADFALHEGVMGEQADIEAADRVLAMATGQPMPWMSSSLADIDRADLVRACMRLGMFITGWRGAHDPDRLSAAPYETAAAVIRAGIDCLTDWPDAFHELMAREATKAASRKGRFGARKALGAVYDWVHEMRPGPLRQLLSAEIAGFVAADSDLAARSRRSRIAAGPDRQCARMTLAEAALALEVSQETVGKMVKAGLLPAPTSEGRGVPMLFDADAVRAVADQGWASIGLKEAAARLGVGLKVMRALVDGGVISPIHRGSEDGWGRWAFRSTDIDRLLEKFRSAGGPVVRPMNFHLALRFITARAGKAGDLVQAVADGRLAVRDVANNARGLAAVIFERSDVEPLFGGRTVEQRTLSVFEAGRRLGFKPEVAMHLVRKKLLRSRKGRVPVEALEEFQMNYITGAEIARRMGTSPKAAAMRLADFGVRPVVGPEVDGSRQNVFRRPEIVAAYGW